MVGCEPTSAMWLGDNREDGVEALEEDGVPSMQDDSQEQTWQG